jgi:hypothetical protein
MARPLEARGDRSRGGAEHGELIKNARVLVVGFAFEDVTLPTSTCVLGEEEGVKPCLSNSRCQIGDAHAAVSQPDRNAEFHGARHRSLARQSAA